MPMTQSGLCLICKPSGWCVPLCRFQPNTCRVWCLIWTSYKMLALQRGYVIFVTATTVSFGGQMIVPDGIWVNTRLGKAGVEALTCGWQTSFTHSFIRHFTVLLYFGLCNSKETQQMLLYTPSVTHEYRALIRYHQYLFPRMTHFLFPALCKQQSRWQCMKHWPVTDRCDGATEICPVATRLMHIPLWWSECGPED